MALADREALARAGALRCRVRPVQFPGVGEVGVRVMRGAEQVQFTNEFRATDEHDAAACYAFACRWLVRLLCDEHGERLYEDGEEALAQVDLLGADAVMEAFTAALKANGLGPREDIEQGFPTTPTARGGSA